MSRISAPIYATATFFSKTGGGLFFFINTWIVIELTGAPAGAAISLLVAVLPSIFLSMAIGGFADRYPPINIVLISEGLRSLILFLYASLYSADLASPLIAYSVSFLMAICAEIQLVSWRVILATYNPLSTHLRFNALSVTSGQAGVVIGAMCSGILFLHIGSTATIYIASMIFSVSTLCIFLLTKGPQIQPSKSLIKAAPIEPSTRRVESTLGLISYIYNRPSLIGNYLLIILNINILYTSNALLAPFVNGPLKLSAKAYGLIDAAYSVGAILGSLIIVALSRYLGETKAIFSGLAVLAMSLLLFAQSYTFPVAFISYVGIGLGCQTSIICLSRAQRITDRALHGRTYALFNTLTGCTGVLVFSLSTRFTDDESLRSVFEYQAIAVAGVLLIFTIVKMYRSL